MDRIVVGIGQIFPMDCMVVAAMVHMVHMVRIVPDGGGGDFVVQIFRMA